MVNLKLYQFRSVAQSCLTLCNPMDFSTPGLPVHHQLPEPFVKLMSISWVMPSNHLILCHPLLLLPSIFPSIRVFSNELVLRIRWPKYWGFSFSISPPNEDSGLLSLRTDSLDLLAFQGTLKSLFHHHSSKPQCICWGFFTFFFFFWPCHAACGMQDISSPTGIETVPPPLGAPSLNHWATREGPYLNLKLKKKSHSVTFWLGEHWA